MKCTFPVSMYFDLISGNWCRKKSEQCGQVTAAYSIKVTGAFGSPCAFSPSGPGVISSSFETSANAGSTKPKLPGTAPTRARAAVPAHNSRRVTRTGHLPSRMGI